MTPDEQLAQVEAEISTVNAEIERLEAELAKARVRHRTAADERRQQEQDLEALPQRREELIRRVADLNLEMRGLAQLTD